jgi:hypothetical protein
VLKNKNRICNNGFSQAVVPRKRNKGLKNLLQNKIQNFAKTALADREGCFIICSTMNVKVRSILDAGGQPVVIDAECHITQGLPNIVILTTSQTHYYQPCSCRYS